MSDGTLHSGACTCSVCAPGLWASGIKGLRPCGTLIKQHLASTTQSQNIQQQTGSFETLAALDPFGRAQPSSLHPKPRYIPNDESLKQRRVQVDPSTLAVTHIFDGEEIVSGGEDGQVYIATFASASAAEFFVFAAQLRGLNVWGDRAHK